MPPILLAPKPGVIPLRPLALGEILDGAVQTIRHNPKVMLGFSAIVIGVTGVLTALIQILTLDNVLSTLQDSSSDTTDPFDAMTAGEGIAGFVLPLVLHWVVTVVLTGLLVVTVSEAVLGHRPTVREVWDRARGRLLPLIGLTIVLGLALTGITVAFVAPGVLVLVGGGATVAGVLLIVFGALAAFIVDIWISTRWLFAPSILMLERQRMGAAFRRSWGLVRGSWWRVFGIWLLAQLLVGVVGGALSVPFTIAGQVVGTSMGDDHAALVVTTLLSTVGQVISTTLVAPFSAAILALLYIDLRMRREALDVALIRASGAVPAQPQW
jgi:hypothetical protein